MLLAQASGGASPKAALPASSPDKATLPLLVIIFWLVCALLAFWQWLRWQKRRIQHEDRADNPAQPMPPARMASAHPAAIKQTAEPARQEEEPPLIVFSRQIASMTTGDTAPDRAPVQAAAQTALTAELAAEEPTRKDELAPAAALFKPSPLFSREDMEEPEEQAEPAAPAAPPPVPAPPPPLDPLAIDFAALRLTANSSRVELRFRIRLRNISGRQLAPVRVAVCMGTAEGDLAETAQDHALAAMMPGQEEVIAEEWRVPLTLLPILRLGSARLLVGTARIITTVEEGAGHQPQELHFLIGLPKEGGGLGPIPLDGTARIYDYLLVQPIAPRHE